MPQAFFVKSRPQDADILDLVKSTKRVFIGYPPWRKDTEYSHNNITECIIDLSTADDDWKQHVYPGQYRPSMQSNYWFTQNVEPGWIVVVPRPGQGVCWIGSVANTFELVSDPPWRNEYLALRRTQNLDCSNEASHIGDVVQSWALSHIRPFPFAAIPRWISYRLLSRPTIGILRDFPELGLRAHDYLSNLLNCGFVEPLRQTSDQAEIERRLLTFLSPSAFEHLCVALLQLERPEETWWHVGGSGDGGADGLGYSSTWQPTAILQCKWHSGASRMSEVFSGGHDHTIPAIFASLIHPDSVEADMEGGIFWGRRTVSELVRKHAANLPMAKSLQIKPG